MSTPAVVTPAAAQARARPSRVVDVALPVTALLYWAYTVATSGALFALLPTWWVGLDLVVGVLAAVALVWRHRHPVGLALALAPVGGLFLTAGLPALVSVFVVAVRARVWVALLATGVHLAIAVPYYLVVPVGGMTLPVWTVLMFMLYATALSLGLAVRSRRQVVDGLLASAERDRAEHEEQLRRARRDERTQIAREMHDVLAHRISLLSVHAGALEFRVRPGTDGRPGAPLTEEELRSAVTVIRESAHRALEELHDVLTVLHDEDGPGRGLEGAALGTARPAVDLPSLPALVAEVSASGQPVELRSEIDIAGPVGLRLQTQRTAYRVVQEGLTNARKHSPGAPVTVVLRRVDGPALEVEVRNTLPLGTTGSQIPGAGSGLAGLAERVGLEGGRLQHGVVDGDFRLRAVLPWRG
ncbi:histidine kinase [Desertihabitans brevis]|uniref:histidine kinase n=1 Tax=Desertihabitans brevis TaxID=2268447 RepID=A0A367YSM5_9ACTN|nr:histidine kinase [Desertihabitans brevis]RCK68757.1 histidine kinase [Desertihabitans brevis]